MSEQSKTYRLPLWLLPLVKCKCGTRNVENYDVNAESAMCVTCRGLVTREMQAKNERVRYE